jgi:hypothetical protein
VFKPGGDCSLCTQLLPASAGAPRQIAEVLRKCNYTRKTSGAILCNCRSYARQRQSHSEERRKAIEITQKRVLRVEKCKYAKELAKLWRLGNLLARRGLGQGEEPDYQGNGQRV